ncbi:MAG: hypothetical protein ACSHX4_04825 [Opitutaceae bacterium]
MIINTPSPDEFRTYGISYLNLAWDSALSDLSQIEEFVEEDDDIVLEHSSDFHRKIGLAITLCHQAMEFFIKGRIAEVSPYLLVANSGKDWPSVKSDADLDFSDLFTVNSQDLPRIYNAVRSDSLSEEFVQRYNKLRKMRNSLMHSINRNTNVRPKDVLLYILQVSTDILGSYSWIDTRRSYLNDNLYSASKTGETETDLAWEIARVMEMLSKGEVRRLLLDVGDRRQYQCPLCFSNDAEIENCFAVLEPNTPASTSIYCLVCEESTTILRRNCDHDDCPGNVIYEGDEVCLTCGRGQEF